MCGRRVGAGHTTMYNYIMTTQTSPHPTHRAFLIAGPSGVGKGTVVKELVKRKPDIWLSISATTRQPRPGEVDGESYYFVTDDEFQAMVDAGDMLEWAFIHRKNYYGTPRKPVEEALKQGKTALLEIDLAGARQVRKTMPDVYQIFLMPPSVEHLEERLHGRGTEDEEAIARRMVTAREEMAAQSEFDAVVLNDSVARATEEILHIMGEIV